MVAKRQEAELKMVQFSFGVIRMESIRNECKREKVSEARLRWFGQKGIVDLSDKGC